MDGQSIGAFTGSTPNSNACYAIIMIGRKSREMSKNKKKSSIIYIREIIVSSDKEDFFFIFYSSP